jgi:hypothetical protein
VEILKAKATFATIIECKLEAEGLVNKTFSELGSLRIEQNALQRQLEIKRNMLEKKMEQAMLGDALLVDTELDSLRLNDAIAKVK